MSDGDLLCVCAWIMKGWMGHDIDRYYMLRRRGKSSIGLSHSVIVDL